MSPRTLDGLRAEVQRRFALQDRRDWAAVEENATVDTESRGTALAADARWSVWEDVLLDVGARRSSAPLLIPDGAGTPTDRAPDRVTVTRLDPPADAVGARPLGILRTRDDEGIATVELAVEPAPGETVRVIDWWTFSCCGACDLVFPDLWDRLDDMMTAALGPVAFLQGRRRVLGPWTVDVWGDGSAGETGRPPVLRRVQRLGRALARGEDVALPTGTEVALGTAWFPTTAGT